MKFFAAALALALLAATPAVSQTPAATCMKPPPPVFPAASAAAGLDAGAFQQHRYARDAYMTAADANLACLDADIDARMRALFASGGAMDAATRAQGLAHEQASRERAEVHEKFLRLCLAYEDTHGAAACR
jgi:hypothetical protein